MEGNGHGFTDKALGKRHIPYDGFGFEGEEDHGPTYEGMEYSGAGPSNRPESTYDHGLEYWDNLYSQDDIFSEVERWEQQSSLHPPWWWSEMQTFVSTSQATTSIDPNFPFPSGSTSQATFTGQGFPSQPSLPSQLSLPITPHPLLASSLRTSYASQGVSSRGLPSTSGSVHKRSYVPRAKKYVSKERHYFPVYDSFQWVEDRAIINIKGGQKTTRKVYYCAANECTGVKEITVKNKNDHILSCVVHNII
ncbi:uncharacterized protein LOC133800600 isoform X2 [Humulus lupulus]|uniref:uncharacterized protein LOC133800600 isoform X2 n=1 Tax=Humulus lupulus TaxID=3486 RepID=UPI002B401D72|nr:uncharacterized protein LOC133800600 isoform X2 [Humulus lupulus]